MTNLFKFGVIPDETILSEREVDARKAENQWTVVKESDRSTPLVEPMDKDSAAIVLSDFQADGDGEEYVIVPAAGVDY